MDNSLIVEGLNIAELNDEDLAEQLRELGFNPGPIVATTRSVYQRKLARLLRNETSFESEDNDIDEEVRPSPLHSTMIHSPDSYKSSSPAYKSSSPSYSFSPSFSYDDLRRRPLSRDPNLYPASPVLSSGKPFSADDIVAQAAPPPAEPEKPLISPLVTIVGLIAIVLFAAFVYFNMESTPVNPFTPMTDSNV